MQLDLPVSSTRVVVRTPTGADDLVLLESGSPNLAIAIRWLDRVVESLDGHSIDWASLSLTDVDVILLRMRQLLVGDVVRTDVTCSQPSCVARVDITFSVERFLQHNAPQQVATPDEGGWYRLGDVEFRVPNVGDQLAASRETSPEQALLARCVRASDISDEDRSAVEASLEALAPMLCTELEGTCPTCGSTVVTMFDPLDYTLRELRAQAALVYDDVCTIASYCHWSEADILAMPTSRRIRYVESVQRGRA